MKAQSSRNLHGTSTWHINMDWISEHCRLWTANLGSLERDLGHADTKCYIAFYHYWINRVGWDPLEYLAWIPFATPEGSRKLFMDPMSYLPVLWGLVLFKILGYPGCLVLFEFLMWFVKKEPRISCLPKWNRTTAGTGLVKLCFCQQYKRTNLNNLNYGDEVNNAIKICVSVFLSLSLLRSRRREADLSGSTNEVPQVNPSLAMPSLKCAVLQTVSRGSRAAVVTAESKL